MTTLICPMFYIFALLGFSYFCFEFNKGLKCSKSPMKTILLTFNFSNERISFYYLCLLSLLFFFFFFFLCHVIFAYDVLSGIFSMSMVFSLNCCLDRPWGFSI